MDPIDCRIFDEQLDAAESDGLSGEALGLLHAHASRCPACAAVLALRERLPGPPLAALEERVPEAWIAEMESRVRAALDPAPLASSDRSRSGTARSGSRWSHLLAAAVLALLLSTGLSLAALDRARDRTAALRVELLEQQRRLTALEGAVGLDGRAHGGVLRASWLRALGTRDGITVGELRDLLDRLPDDAPVASPARLDAALARARWAPPRWRRAFDALPADGTELTVAGARDALDRLGLPPGTAVPADRLLDLIS